MVNVLFMCSSVYAAGKANWRDLVGYLFLYEYEHFLDIFFFNKYIRNNSVALLGIYC